MANAPDVTAADPDSPAKQPRPTWRARAIGRATAAAMNPASSGIKLWLLYQLFPAIRPIDRALAENPATSERLLRRAAMRSLRRGHWNIAVIAAGHPACSLRLFHWLLWSSYPAVEVAVATNPRASSLLMERLTAGVPEARFRLQIAANPAAPTEVITRLLTDQDPYVRRVAAAHPAATPEGLRRLCGDMSQPAWTLRAAATNPACPPDLSDQLLTWLALGGAGASDPHFDPITCSGHPGSTEVQPHVWYVNAARLERAETHPLWRVRAAIPIARPRVLIVVLKHMALDPQVEVRRQAARFRALPVATLRELRADTDPAVARLAVSALKDRPKDPRRRLRWKGNPLRLGVGIAILIGVVFVNTHVLSPSVELPTLRVGYVQLSDGSLLPGVVSMTRTEVGGGAISAGTVTGYSDLPRMPFISVVAGIVSLTVTVPGAFTTGAESLILSGPVQVASRQRLLVVLPTDPTSVDVTIVTPGQIPISQSFVFGGTG